MWQQQKHQSKTETHTYKKKELTVSTQSSDGSGQALYICIFHNNVELQQAQANRSETPDSGHAIFND